MQQATENVICFVFNLQEPALQGGLNRAPGAPVVKTTPGKHLTPVQKLLHLAEVEGFRVQFTDYPKVRIKHTVKCVFTVLHNLEYSVHFTNFI